MPSEPKSDANRSRWDKYIDDETARGQEEGAKFDKTTLYLAGGALTVSIAFIKDLLGGCGPKDPLLLQAAWGVLAFGLLAAWGTPKVAQRSFYRSVQQAKDLRRDGADPAKVQGVTWGSWWKYANYSLVAASLVSVIAGTSLLAAFAIANVSQIGGSCDDSGSGEQETRTSAEPGG